MGQITTGVGLVSGLDINSIVEQLIAIDEVVVERAVRQLRMRGDISDSSGFEPLAGKNADGAVERRSLTAI